MSALVEYCDHWIAECQQMAKDYPQDAWRFEQHIKGWQRIRQQMIKKFGEKNEQK
ncbi:hypothetical protein [Shewanella sp. KCT]|uniref:hypothetical protein n=1 Tax=Shewanella sp. KCT TaxID=2569535 RepID=UPI00164267B6|nr:hypothetical protein [Shewanella sp. KCT]